MIVSGMHHEKKLIFVLFVLLVSVLLALIVLVPAASAQEQSEYVEAAFPNLTFDQPVGIFNARDGTNRLFVIEQAGIIRVFKNMKNITVSQVFLCVSDLVLFGGEQGLLVMAFHPEYPENGYF
jgi:hypothetical protein